MAALSGSLMIEHPGRRPHALHYAAAENSNDIDLMRNLVVNDSSSQFGTEFFWPARPIEKAGVVPSIDHCEWAKAAGPDDLPHLADRQIKAMRVADDHVHPGVFSRLDHP